MDRRSTVAWALIAVLVSALLPVTEAGAATITVTRKDDPVPNGCNTGGCSLREAIQRANQNANADVIVLGTGVYNLQRSGAGENAAAAGDLDITSKVTIRGKGATKTIVEANDLDRAFHVLAGASGVVIEKLAIRGGSVIATNTPGQTPSPTTPDGGGGLLNQGGLKLQSVVVNDNASPNCCGGGIFNIGQLTVNSSRIHHNSAHRCCGGGLLNIVGKTTINNTRFDHNSAMDCCGGALLNSDDGTLVVSGSTFDNNHAPDCCGGAIFNEDPGSLVTVKKTRFFENTVDECCGGALINLAGAEMVIEDSRVFDNFADNCCGGGFFNGGANSKLTLRNSVVERNVTRVCCGGGISTGETAITTLVGTTIRNNVMRRGCCGGGLNMFQQARIIIKDSLVSGNRVTGTENPQNEAPWGTGGGLYIDSEGIGAIAEISNSTFFANDATQYGGAIYVDGPGSLNLLNSTLSGNKAGVDGGGILSDNGAVDMSFTTIAGNSAAHHGGGVAATGAFVVASSIVGGNPGGDCFSILTSATGVNLDKDSSCFDGAEALHADPKLKPLANYGGKTPTRALKATSPAIDAVPPGCPPPAKDQRGTTRPQNGDKTGPKRCDLGSFELKP